MSVNINQPIRDKLEKAERRYQKNLELFRQKAPALYKQITEAKRPRLSVDPNNLELSRLTDEGTNYYAESPINHALNEFKRFNDLIDNKIYAPLPSNLDLTFLIKEKPFHGTAKKYAEYIGQQTEKRKHMLPANLDVVVFGIGLGLHVEMLCNSKQYTHITIIEKDVRNLIASMYIVDWNALLAGLDKQSTLTFHIHQGEGFDDRFEKSLREHFIRLYPSIGVSTIIYNHEPFAREYDDAKHIIEEYASHVKVSSEMIGPEAQRLFNANENVLKGFPAIDFANTIANPDKLLTIVGAGPSLDHYADILREHRDNFFLISAGSGLSSLLKLNIIPDLHFELEFQHLATSLLKHVDQTFDLKQLDLICTYEAHPGFTGMFRNTYMFIPESSELQPTIGSTHTLRRGGITCTNGATAFASEISDQAIYLVGLDFAHTGGEHHSKTNISNEATLPDELQRIKTVSQQRQANIKLKSTSGGEVFTSTGLNSARITMETLLRDISNPVYNCSAGAHIEGTTYTSPDDLLAAIEKKPKDNKSDASIHFVTQAIDAEKVYHRTQEVIKSSLSVANELKKEIQSFDANAKLNAIKTRELFNRIGHMVGQDMGKYRNAMSVSKYPLYQLFVICNFTNDDYQSTVLKSWLEEFESYLDFLETTFTKMIEDKHFVTNSDWMY